MLELTLTFLLVLLVAALFYTLQKLFPNRDEDDWPDDMAV